MAAADTTTTTEVTMKLLINAKERRVVYAEASRDVVAFLYSLLVSPDTPFTLDDMTFHGCTDSICDSLDELDDLAARGGAPPPPPQPQQEARRRFFVCAAGRRRRGARCGEYVAVRSGAKCPACGGRMDAEAPRGAPGAGCSWASHGGQQAGAGAAGAGGRMTCTLMDDLTIGPAPGTALALVGATARAGITMGVDPAAFQEATVRIGRKEGLEILEASLHSGCVLTNVFLRGDGKAPALELQPTPLTPDLVLLGGYAHECTRTH